MPARARRRKVLFVIDLTQMPQFGETPLEFSEKVGFWCTKPEYPEAKPFIRCGAGIRKEIIIKEHTSMKMNSVRKWLSFIVCMVLIAAMALCMSGCNDLAQEKATEPTVFSDGQSLGQGATKFTLQVVDLDGTTATVQISTDEKTVGQALQELGVLKGEQGAFGLYIKEVNGITYDYDTDGAYWGFYINGEYALTGVDTTDIVEGTTYTLKAEKAA